MFNKKNKYQEIYIQHLYSIKNLDLLDECLQKELLQVAIMVSSDDQDIMKILVNFENWLSITIKDDHAIIKSEKRSDVISSNENYKIIYPNDNIKNYIGKRLHRVNSIINDKRFKFSICLEFEDYGRLIVANEGYNTNGFDKKSLIYEIY